MLARHTPCKLISIQSHSFIMHFILLSLFIQQGIMRPLMELSASLDTYRPNSAALFRAISAGSKSELILNEGKCLTCALHWQSGAVCPVNVESSPLKNELVVLK